jgi:hypothetical protein
MDLALSDLVDAFARAIEKVDALAPVARSHRSGMPYKPGIGPHTEAQTIKSIMGYLAEADRHHFGSYQLGVPYGDGTRQTCDLCLGSPRQWDWAVEVKMLRLVGDNGKLNDNILMHILSPYPAHRSALTDCTKLVMSKLGRRNAVIIYGYEFPAWPMSPAIDAFQILARKRVYLANAAAAPFNGLIHPVHRQGHVFGWEIQPL